MGRILGSWSGMRNYLEEEMLAKCLHGRIRYGCTIYAGMDGFCIFEIYVDGILTKRFSWETVNNYFIATGYKEKSDMVGVIGYWQGFRKLLNEIPIQSRTEYADDEFSEALAAYRNQNIQESIESENPMIRMFAVLDRRIGKRTLEKIKDSVKQQPEWLQEFYRLRVEAESKQ